MDHLASEAIAEGFKSIVVCTCVWTTFRFTSWQQRVGVDILECVVEVPSRKYAGRGLIDHLSRAKSTLSLHTSQVCQAIVGGVLHDTGYSLRRRCRESTRLYRRKRDELARALRESAASSAGLRRARWSTPAGGFFMPLELPRSFLRRDLVALRDQYGVLVTPMSEFSVSGARTNSIRLAFSALPLEKIRPGVERLAAYLSLEA